MLCIIEPITCMGHIKDTSYIGHPKNSMVKVNDWKDCVKCDYKTLQYKQNTKQNPIAKDGNVLKL